MHKDLDALFGLQTVDSEMMLVQRALHGLDQGQAELTALQQATESHASAHQALHRATRDMTDADLEQKGVEVKKKQFEDKLYGGRVQAFKELETIQQEIAALGRRRGDLDERILALMDEVETLTPLESAARSALDAAQNAYDTKQVSYSKRTALLTAKLKELTAQRSERLPAIPDDLLRRYDAIRAHGQGVGIGRIDAGRCGACHTNLPAQTVHSMKHGGTLRTCDNCGRMLCWGSE